MRFTAAAVLFAGAAMATESIVYSTDIVTVISCAPTITNCPARSTQVQTTVYAVTTSSAAPVYANSSSPAGVASSSPVLMSTGVASPPPMTTVAPASPSVCVPSQSVETISTSITTVIPTVIYKTVAIPCPTSVAPQSVGTSAGSSGLPLPTTSAPAVPVTAGAATFSGSVLVAAAAGLAAMVLA